MRNENRMHTEAFTDFSGRLDVSMAAGLVEISRVGSFLVIWKQFDSVALKEVDKILGSMNAISCVLDLPRGL